MANRDRSGTFHDVPTSPAATPVASDRLAVAATVVTVLLTAAAFWLSYQHLHDVADAHGLAGSTVRAWAWPATVDLFIVVGELLILRASLAHRVDPWAIALAVAGSGGSIALNVAGVGADADPLNYVVAAVPPVAALLAFGALMRQVHEYLAARTATEPATPDADPATPDADDTAPELTEATPDETLTKDDDDTPAPVTYDSPVDQCIRALYDQLGARPVTGQMTAAMLAAGLGDSESTARSARRRIEKREPHLLDLPTSISA